MNRAIGRISFYPKFTIRGTTVRMYTPIVSAHVLRDALWLESGTREPELLDWLDQTPKCSTFFDVGSSFGQESMYLGMRMAARGEPISVYAFNADPEGNYLFSVNRALNNLQTVRLIDGVVTDSPGYSQMELPSHRRWPWKARKINISMDIANVVLDDFCEVRGVYPNRVKIDVDGGELRVLRGMDKLLRSSPLTSVYIEVDHALFDDAVNFLSNRGFAIKSRNTYEVNSNCIFERSS
jgi:FkbM family methyltransferase